jgi:energy-coupling factor transporter ATP-binding protein EcfA2
VSLRRRAGTPDLEDRLAALAAAVDAGHGVLPSPVLGAGQALVARAGERLGHGLAHTVVALAGATGSGKSSLFNALAGADLSTVGVRRPTTSATHACWWGDDATALLDWLQVPRRHHAADDPRLHGLVLLDLPDHDSTACAHRDEVDRVVAVADVVVWVLDPQKYADAAVHERYLRPLAHHAGVLVVVLHQADLLGTAELAACRADLAALLRDDGLGDIDVLTTSVRREGGTDALRAVLTARVRARRSAVERLEADLTAVAGAFEAACGGGGIGIDRAARGRVVDALVEAAGVGVVVNAVAGSHRAAAAAATGWPDTRWLRRLRPDPLRRLHLGDGGGSGGRTSLPAPSAVSVARVETAVRSLADDVSGPLPLEWRDAVRDDSAAHLEMLPTRIDAAVSSTDLGAARRPRWWRPVGALQVLLAAVAVAGAAWLAALFGLAYLQLGDVATPEVGPLPVPTAMLLGGVVAGLLVAFFARLAAGLGARRRARRARARLEEAVLEVARSEAFAPVDAVLARHRRFCEAVAVVARGRRA